MSRSMPLGYSDYLIQRDRREDAGGRACCAAQGQGRCAGNANDQGAAWSYLEAPNARSPIAEGRDRGLQHRDGAPASSAADPDLYRRNAADFQAKTKRLGAAQSELDAAETEWLELEMLRKS